MLFLIAVKRMDWNKKKVRPMEIVKRLKIQCVQNNSYLRNSIFIHFVSILMQQGLHVMLPARVHIMPHSNVSMNRSSPFLLRNG